MRPLGVVEADPVVDDPFDLEAVGALVQVDGLLFKGSPEPFDEDVIQIPTSAMVRVVTPSAPVYWLPWSVFMISGLPHLAMASSSASTQKLASSVLESR